MTVIGRSHCNLIVINKSFLLLYLPVFLNLLSLQLWSDGWFFSLGKASVLLLISRQLLLRSGLSNNQKCPWFDSPDCMLKNPWTWYWTPFFFLISRLAPCMVAIDRLYKKCYGNASQFTISDIWLGLSHLITTFSAISLFSKVCSVIFWRQFFIRNHTM